MDHHEPDRIRDESEFLIEPGTLAGIIEAQRSLLATAQIIHPILAEHFKAQQGFSQNLHQMVNEVRRHSLADANGIKSLVEAANLANATAGLRGLFNQIHELGAVSIAMRSALDAASFVDSIVRQDAFIQIHTESLKLSEVARGLPRIDAEVLRIKQAFSPAITAFSTLREALFQSKNDFCEFRSAFREQFLTSDLLHSLVVPEENDEFVEERTVLIKEADDQLILKLPEALSELDFGLYQMWHGAWDALVSDNPDRIRHTLVSVRELITQVLHMLAPDDQVRAWSHSPEHYYNGRPTRSARLLFIHSQINSPEMKDYFRKEIGACVEFIDLLNDGTHDIVPNFSDAQVKIMLRRAHFTICTLVEIHKAKAQ